MTETYGEHHEHVGFSIIFCLGSFILRLSGWGILLAHVTIVVHFPLVVPWEWTFALHVVATFMIEIFNPVILAHEASDVLKYSLKVVYFWKVIWRLVHVDREGLLRRIFEKWLVKIDNDFVVTSFGTGWFTVMERLRMVSQHFIICD